MIGDEGTTETQLELSEITGSGQGTVDSRLAASGLGDGAKEGRWMCAF